MNEAQMSEAESIAADKIAAEGAAVGAWTQSLLRRIGSGLKTRGAKLQDAVSAPAAPAVQTGQPATERAEATLDQAGERIGLFAASLSHQVRRSAALVREEAEDILAEAQSLRQKDQA